jgi:hypothetical protein
MIRTLLATTAVAAVLALPVIAQDASSSVESSATDSSMSSMESSAMDSSAMSSEAPADSSMMSSESSMVTDTSSAEVVTDASSEVVTEQPTGPFDIVTGYTQIDSDSFATRIIGQPVYDSGAADANHLGDINDLVVNENGTIAAVIIGVGGFLGIGEKQVAVAYAALERVVAEDQTERFVVQTTVEDLTAAPDFVVVEDDTADGTVSAPVAGDAMTPAPADPMAPAPAEGDAMASSSAAQ